MKPYLSSRDSLCCCGLCSLQISPQVWDALQAQIVVLGVDQLGCELCKYVDFLVKVVLGAWIAIHECARLLVFQFVLESRDMHLSPLQECIVCVPSTSIVLMPIHACRGILFLWLGGIGIKDH